MKKIILSIAIVIAIYSSNAQNTIPSSGNVGIGTTSPSTLLTLKGGAFSFQTNVNQYTLANVDSYSTTPFTPGAGILGLVSGDMMLRSYWGISIDINDGGQGDNNQGFYTRIPSTTSFTINSRTSPTTFNTLFAVRNNGNVLIGKTTQTNAGYILDINGYARANGITVNSTGADFVFEPNYKLITLTDLSKYLRVNHHLPGIASAKQMQTDGLNLGDNQTKILQKVEELTLYLIEKDKQLIDEKTVNNQQQEKLDLQQKQIEMQQQQINSLIKEVSQLKKGLSK